MVKMHLLVIMPSQAMVLQVTLLQLMGRAKNAPEQQLLQKIFKLLGG